MLRLCYYHPALRAGTYQETDISSDMEGFDSWIWSMMEIVDHAIFFLVQITTDVDFP